MIRINNDTTLNNNKRTNIFNNPVYLDEALVVLRDDIDYAAELNGKIQPGKIYTPALVPELFQNIYAIDCEMVYMETRQIYDPSLVDNRKKLIITEKDIQNYIKRKDVGQPKIKDEVYIDYSKHKDPKELEKVSNYLEFYHLYREKDFNINIYQLPGNRWDATRLNENLGTQYMVSALARITITDFNGKIIRDNFIKPEIVNGHKTKVLWCPVSSNIDISFYDDKEMGSMYDESNINTFYPWRVSDVKTEAEFIFNKLFDTTFKTKNGALLIGHNLIGSDYQAMELERFIAKDTHSYLDFILGVTRDTNRIFGYIHTWKNNDTLNGIKIAHLVKAFLNLNVQVSAGHDPSEDARASLAIYKLFRLAIEDSFRLGTPDVQFYIHNLKNNTHPFNAIGPDEPLYIRNTKGVYLQEIIIKIVIRNIVIHSKKITQTLNRHKYKNLTNYLVYLLTS